MTGISQRRNRVLKIRAINRRMAEQRLALSEGNLRHVARIGDRVAALRMTIVTKSGLRLGSELRANGEMVVRLDGALSNIAASMMSFTEERDRQRDLFLTARQNEVSAEKLVETEAKSDREQTERRQNGTRIFRRATDFPGFDA